MFSKRRRYANTLTWPDQDHEARLNPQTEMRRPEPDRKRLSLLIDQIQGSGSWQPEVVLVTSLQCTVDERRRESQRQTDRVSILAAGARHKPRAEFCPRRGVDETTGRPAAIAWRVLASNVHHAGLGNACERPQAQRCQRREKCGKGCAPRFFQPSHQASSFVCFSSAWATLAPAQVRSPTSRTSFSRVYLP
ncbi:hypothetical protein D9M71_581870 [compost metagenome]